MVPMSDASLFSLVSCTKDMYSYVFVILPSVLTYLFVRALSGKMRRRSTREGRPDTVVKVWARCEQYRAPGGGEIGGSG